MERKSWATLGIWVLGVVWFWVIRWRRKRKIDEKKREMVSNSGIESSSGSIKGRERLIPKGSFGWPLIGETLDFINCGCTSRPVSFMDKRRSLYGEVFKSHILGRPMIVSTDAEVNKFVLQNDGTIFVPFYPESIRKLLGETSILRMYGSFHKKIHGLIGRFLKSPSFKARIAEEIEKSMLSSMKNWKDGQLIYLQDETKMTTFQVLLRVLLGIGPGEELDFFKKEFEEFIKGLVCLPIKLPGTRLHKSLKAKERMKMHIKKVIEDRMKEGQRDLVMDVADVLLNATSESNEQQKLSFDSICGSITELMIPGEHSVPMLMTLAVKYLSDSPCALKQLVEENMTLKKEKISSGESYAWTDYMSLQFTHNVINETLRMGNIVNGVWRKALNDVEIKGYLIPKGWCILTSFSSIHLNEDNYKNPYQFDPWRWQRKEGGGQSNFTPFGGGHRLCPGLELSRLEVSIFLHHFVTSYSWVAENDDIINFPIVKMRRGLPIILSTISSSEKEELN